MRYILDTNILIHIIRKSPTFERINQKYDLFSGNHQLLISAVTIGELESFALQNQWGKKRISEIPALLEDLETVIIDKSVPIMRTYAEIDAFSQGRHPTLKLNDSARNMGKNQSSKSHPIGCPGGTIGGDGALKSFGFSAK